MADIHGQQAGSNTEPVPRRSAGRTRPAAGWRGCADRRAGGQGLAAVDPRHGNRRRQARPRRADSFPVPEERSQSVRIPADRRPGQAAGRLVPQAAIQVRDRDLRQAALLTAVPPQELGDTGCIGCHGACGQAPLLPQTGREDRQPVRVRHRWGAGVAKRPAKRSQLTVLCTSARPAAALRRAGDSARHLRGPKPRSSRQMGRDQPQSRPREPPSCTVFQIAQAGSRERSGKVPPDNGFPLEELFKHSWISFRKRKRSNHHQQPDCEPLCAVEPGCALAMQGLTLSASHNDAMHI